jgi:hypothetical protein
MYAVLAVAFLCFQKQFEIERRGIQRGRAEECFFSDDFQWLFSFRLRFIRMKLGHWSQASLDILQRKM